MNTKLQVRIIDEEEAVVGRSVNQALSNAEYEINVLKAVNDAKIHATPQKERTLVKTIGMLFAAPFIALAYVIALPFIGLYQLAKLAMEAYAKRSPAANDKLRKTTRFAKNIGLFFASPFIALAYVAALPVVGFYMFVKLAKEAKAKSGHANA